ncbi:MAG: OmpA family protein [SAR324 cluster bacterium]|nr:OmpA family protein [SAR324 cluster bacterium]
MKNFSIKLKIHQFLVLLILTGSLGCSTIDQAYSSIVGKDSEEEQKENAEKKQKKLEQQRQREFEKNKEQLKSLNAELSQAKSEKQEVSDKIQNTQEQLEVISDRLEITESRNAELGEVLAKTDAQFESTKSRLEIAESQIETLSAELAKTKRELGESTEQLEKTVAINNKLEKNIRDSFLQLVKMEQKEEELKGTIRMMEEQKIVLNAQIAQFQNEISEKEKLANTLIPRQKKLMESLRSQLESEKIKITELSNRIAVRLDEQLLFDSGQAFVKASGFKVLKRVGAVLKKIHDKHIQVEGYTDNFPIVGQLKKKYATNWELSAARASTVTRYLVEVIKIAPNRISSAGFGEFQPIADNKTPEGRRANRRVEFALFPLRSTGFE